jgi:hypothetical protein
VSATEPGARRQLAAEAPVHAVTSWSWCRLLPAQNARAPCSAVSAGMRRRSRQCAEMVTLSRKDAKELMGYLLNPGVNNGRSATEAW